MKEKIICIPRKGDVVELENDIWLVLNVTHTPYTLCLSLLREDFTYSIAEIDFETGITKITKSHNLLKAVCKLQDFKKNT